MSQPGQNGPDVPETPLPLCPKSTDVIGPARLVRFVPKSDVTPASEKRRSMVWAASSSQGSLDRLDQRPRGERLFEIGEALGLKRRRANGGGIVPGHVDDRHSIPSRFEAMP